MICHIAVLLCALAAASAAVPSVLDLKDADGDRIVGGVNANYGDHPYICSLQRQNWIYWSHVCGSVIFNENYVVTAAHCLGEASSSYRVVCGKHQLSTTSTYEVSRSLKGYTIHPGYQGSGDGYPNDIAVLHLSSPLTFNSHVKKARFANTGSGDFLGQTCTLSGWGLTSGGGSGANTLQRVNLTVISNSECQTRWQQVQGATINAGHICFHVGYGLSACNGDSGGPVRCGNTLTGVTSWGMPSCDGSFPSVYTRVSYFYSWLISLCGAN